MSDEKLDGVHIGCCPECDDLFEIKFPATPLQRKQIWGGLQVLSDLPPDMTPAEQMLYALREATQSFGEKPLLALAERTEAVIREPEMK